MHDVTQRVASVQAAVGKLRAELPAIEWRAGQMLAQIAELAAIVGEVASGAGQAAPRPTDVADTLREANRRAATVEHLLWLACRGLPRDLEADRRDAEVCRVCMQWGISEQELSERGYRSRGA